MPGSTSGSRRRSRDRAARGARSGRTNAPAGSADRDGGDVLDPLLRRSRVHGRRRRPVRALGGRRRGNARGSGQSDRRPAGRGAAGGRDPRGCGARSGSGRAHADRGAGRRGTGRGRTRACRGDRFARGRRDRCALDRGSSGSGARRRAGSGSGDGSEQRRGEGVCSQFLRRLTAGGGAEAGSCGDEADEAVGRQACGGTARTGS